MELNSRERMKRRKKLKHISLCVSNENVFRKLYEKEEENLCLFSKKRTNEMNENPIKYITKKEEIKYSLYV